MTKGELMSLHIKILSLYETLGISYKDACHWLYMTECEKLKMDQQVKKAFSVLNIQTKDAHYICQSRLDELAHAGSCTYIASVWRSG